MRNKRGQGQGAVWKIIATMLASFFLVVGVVMIYQGFNPAKEESETLLNKVLIFLNIRKDSSATYSCEPRYLKGFQAGIDLMNELEIDEATRESTTFELCKGECKLDNTGFGSYRVLEEERFKDPSEAAKINGETITIKNFDRWGRPVGETEKKWIPYNAYFRGEKIEDSKFYQELYSSLFEQFGEDDSFKGLKGDILKIQDYYESKNTKVLVLESESGYILWQNYFWIYYRNEDGRTWHTTNTVTAIDKFLELLVAGSNDEVYYRILQSKEAYFYDPDNLGNKISTFSAVEASGNIMRIKSDDEPYDVEERGSLKDLVNAKILELKREVGTEPELIDFVGGIVNGESVEAEGKTYDLSFEEVTGLGYKAITFTNQDEKYALIHDANDTGDEFISNYHKVTEAYDNYGEFEKRGFGIFELNSLDAMLVRVKDDGSIEYIKGELDYKLKDVDVKIFEKVSRVKAFLESICY